MNKPVISVVVPVYGCVGCLEQLCIQLESILESLVERYEIILVDDCSPDNAWSQICRLQERFKSLKGVRLSRNYGQHIAITAGLAESQGDCAVVMDCDLQDPPGLIPELYAKLMEGNDIVLARRVERSHSLFRRVAARTYFKLLSKLTEEEVDGSYGSFSILSRKVINSFLQFKERERHYLFIIRWLGFKITSIDYKHEDRAIGESSYTFRRLMRHAFDGLFFQATVFLQWIVGIGFAFAAFGLGLAIYYMYQYFTQGSVAGWTTVVVLILICTGIILLSLGVMGLYVGKIFNQTKERPLYLIDIISDINNQ